MGIGYPIINGNRMDFSSVQFSVLGNKRIIGVREIGYTTTLQPGDVYGTSAQLIGRTRGQLKPEGYFTIYKEDWDDLTNVLVGLAAATSLGTSIANNVPIPNLPAIPVGFMEVAFNIMVAFSETPVSPVQVDSLFGCRIQKVDHAYAQGSDALTVRCDLHIMYALYNKKSPINVLAT